MSQDPVATVLALERELQSATARRDPGRLAALIAEDFVEVGASGQVWDHASTLALLAGEGEQEAPIEVHDLTGRIIDDGVVMVQWDSRRGDRRARRTSLWRHDPHGWRIVHHQGTVLPARADPSPAAQRRRRADT